MKIMTYMLKKASWKRVILLLLTSVCLGVCIITMFFGLLKLNPDATMDSLNYYNSETFFTNLDIQEREGRTAYLILHLFDYIFITQFYTLFAFIIYMLSQKLAINNPRIEVLALIPFFPAAMDLLENISIDISIFMYPKKIMVIGSISGIFSFLKMYSIYVVILIILGLLIVRLIAFIRNRKKNPLE